MTKIRSRKSKSRASSRKKMSRRMRKQIVDLFPRTGGFPRKMKMVHRYAEIVTLNCGTGTQGYYTFSTNSLYDPNTTGTGHQPMFFDQMTAIYNHYTVVGSKITIKFVPPASSAGVASIVALYINDVTTPLTSVITAQVEQNRSKWVMLSGLAPKTQTLTQKWSAKKNFGKYSLDNTDLQGTAVTGPAEQQYFQITAQASDLSSTVLVNFIVEIEYIAVWHELKTQGQS